MGALRAIVDASPMLFAYFDERDNFVFVNRAYAKQSGQEPEFFIGRNVREIVTEDRLNAHRAYIEIARSGRSVTYERKLEAPGEPARYVSITIVPDPDPLSRKPKGYVVWVSDITDRVALRESESFLNSLFENIPNMIFVKEAKELRFVRLNRAGEALLGYSREEMLGKNDYDFFPKAQAKRLIEFDQRVLHGKDVVDIPEEPIRTRSAGTRILHTKKIPINGEGDEPRYLVGISEDITDRKRAEQERDHSRANVKNLESERELREKFVSTLTHDLRGPLTVARTSAELLRGTASKATLQESQKDELISRIIGSIDRADHMIRDLLDANRIRGGHRLPLQIHACELRAIAREALDEMKVIHGDRFRLEAPAPVSGWWSGADLRRTIDNLVSNAVKYGAPGTPITVRLREAPGRKVELSVHNHGNELSASETQVIFQYFGRTRAAYASGQKGWGLGLTLVRGIVDAHGGEVHVESGEGRGTTFCVTLPIDARKAVTR